jgi:hypothetical protein
MATQTYTDTPKVRVIWVTGTLTLDPLNDAGNTKLQEIFDTDGALTTVAITQVDANRDGYGQTAGAYNGLALALS